MDRKCQELLAACRMALMDLATDGARMGLKRYGEKEYEKHIKQLREAISNAERETTCQSRK